MVIDGEKEDAIKQVLGWYASTGPPMVIDGEPLERRIAELEALVASTGPPMVIDGELIGLDDVVGDERHASTGPPMVIDGEDHVTQQRAYWQKKLQRGRRW